MPHISLPFPKGDPRPSGPPGPDRESRAFESFSRDGEGETGGVGSIIAFDVLSVDGRTVMPCLTRWNWSRRSTSSACGSSSRAASSFAVSLTERSGFRTNHERPWPSADTRQGRTPGPSRHSTVVRHERSNPAHFGSVLATASLSSFRPRAANPFAELRHGRRNTGVEALKRLLRHGY